MLVLLAMPFSANSARSQDAVEAGLRRFAGLLQISDRLLRVRFDLLQDAKLPISRSMNRAPDA